MILYLIRHGIAIDRADPEAPPEAERPLTARGVQKTRAAALGFSEAGAKPDIIITSPYIRAAQTAEIFAEAARIRAGKDTSERCAEARRQSRGDTEGSITPESKRDRMLWTCASPRFDDRSVGWRSRANHGTEESRSLLFRASATAGPVGITLDSDGEIAAETCGLAGC